MPTYSTFAVYEMIFISVDQANTMMSLTTTGGSKVKSILKFVPVDVPLGQRLLPSLVPTSPSLLTPQVTVPSSVSVA